MKTAEEIARIEAAIGNPSFGAAESLSVEFLVDPGFVEEVLPPPLEPAEEPRMRAMVGRWQSNCVGDFAGGALYISVRHDGVAGDYNFFQYMDTDASIIYGRDVFGEPKKMASSCLRRQGDRLRGSLERGGLKIVELEGEMESDLGPGIHRRSSFNFKSRPAADGVGLEEDAILTRADFEAQARVALEGTGTLRLRGTADDPLDQIPVTGVIRATYTEADMRAKCNVVARTPREVFLPYHHTRNDYWPAHSTEG
ncbi:MAG: acetoacetate decarboxylase family protein [Solirubrobacterales bacterium]